ncbi:MAG: phytoene desaturase family protein [Pseudomonadota bacterium]
MAQRAIVIGGGFGGLSAAFRLQAAGVSTTLIERQDCVGGKARNHPVGPHAIPGGPTVLTLREVFDDLFAVVGERLEDHVEVAPLEILAHHRWSPDERLDLYRDVDDSADAVEAFAGKTEADGYRRFVADASRIFSTIEEPFIKAPKPDLFAIARAVGPLGAHKIKPFDTMWSAICRHFRDPRLRQLFGRYASYCGASPFQAPATLMLVAHAEQRGVWAIDGGTAALAKAIAARFQRMGGDVLTGVEAREIVVERRAVCGVETDGAGRLPADTVVFNGDPAALRGGLLGQRVTSTGFAMVPRTRTLSAVTLCASVVSETPLAYHTVAFSRDYPAEFDALFKRREMPEEPTIYVCTPDPPTGADGRQGILIVMNAPADGDTKDYGEEDIARCQQQAMATLSRCGLNIDFKETCATTPSDFADFLPGTGGAIYGRTSHGWTASFQRPAPRTKVRGLYLAGGSVHPGPGAPMASLSGQMAAKCLLQDFALAMPSRQVAMSGGISTG